jgi:hypothetical protein
MGPRTGLDDMEKTTSWPCWESNLGRPARCPSLYQLRCSNFSYSGGVAFKSRPFYIDWNFAEIYGANHGKELTSV